jgi:hypothetical protein
MCQVRELIKLLKENYSAKKSQFEPFALECRGHQTGFASLLREKVKRQQKEKDGTTRKKSPAKRASTKKASRDRT